MRSARLGVGFETLRYCQFVLCSRVRKEVGEVNGPRRAVTVKHISTFAEPANNREKHTETKDHNINAKDDIRALSAKISGSRARIIIRRVSSYIPKGYVWKSPATTMSAPTPRFTIRLEVRRCISDCAEERGEQAQCIAQDTVLFKGESL